MKHKPLLMLCLSFGSPAHTKPWCTPEIAGDGDGEVYQDLMFAVEFVVENCPFIDGDRIGAAGASYFAV